MNRAKALGQLCVDLNAVVSVAQVAAGRLAALAAGETIEITPDAQAGPTVTLMAGGRTIATARLRHDGDRLIARIVSIGDAIGAAADQWRFYPKV